MMSQNALLPMSQSVDSSDELESTPPQTMIDQPEKQRPGLFSRIMEAIGRSYAPPGGAPMIFQWP
jgi:hypothetical protein